MAVTIQYGRCTNKARCSLAYNKEAVFVPVDGKCPECGQPLQLDTVSRRRFKFLTPLVVLALLAAGGYYGWTKYLGPGHGGKTMGGDSSAMGGGSTMKGGTTMGMDNAGGGGADNPPPPGGAVDKPNFALDDDVNAKTRRDVLARIDVMPNLTEAQKAKLTTSVDRARSMGCVFIIPFDANKKVLGTRETDILASGFKSASIQKMMEVPTLVFVVLGYADKQGDAQQNLKTSVDRAQSVLNAMRDRCGVQNVMYAVGMGGAAMVNAAQTAKNRVVEVWAVYP